MSIIPDKLKSQNNAQEISGNVSGNDLEPKEFQNRLELLYDVAQQANSFPEVSELLKEILHVMQRLMHASASSLLLINKEREEFSLQAAGGNKSNILQQIRMSLDSGIMGWVVRNGKPAIVNNAYEDKRFNKEIDEATGFVTKSIIAVPIIRGKNVIGVIEIINKVDGSSFNERDLIVLSGLAKTEALIMLVSMAATAINNINFSRSIKDEYNDTYRNTVETLVKAADAKDPYARGHSRHVMEYAMLAAKSLRFSSEELQAIEFGAMLHDIGKIGISDAILSRPGPLTPGEWYIMRKHALRGANIVSEIPSLAKARDIVLYHHERYDGKGYPEGLKGKEIPIGARIVAVADAFDTMVTEHSYRAALSLDEAKNELIKGSGTQFCPTAVDAFLSGLQKHKGNIVTEEAEREAAADAKREAEEASHRRETEKLAEKEAELKAAADAKR
ncbi:HD-GYP domain-containing protein, partial [Chloroflexota bacterium]